MRKVSLHLLFAAAAALALVGCGGSDTAPDGSAAGPAPQPAPSPAPPEPAPSPPPVQGDYSIAGVDFAQSMVFASSDPELVLVGNRAALVKVNVVAATPPATKPSGTLRIEDASGALIGELVLTAPTGNLPAAAPTRPSFADSYSAIIPGAWVRNGMRVSAQFTPAASNAPTITPRVGGSVALRVVAV
ncbi:MAG TPA: hypothetical protein VFK10_03290, partial [Burkholderiaceae bacterium]|nr:hypothetical protein [Burkholderiaceae bacterium]